MKRFIHNSQYFNAKKKKLNRRENERIRNTDERIVLFGGEERKRSGEIKLRQI